MKYKLYFKYLKVTNRYTLIVFPKYCIILSSYGHINMYFNNDDEK